MMGLRITRIVRALLLMFAVGTMVELVAPAEAEARAGRGRSYGRSSGFGSKQQQQPRQRQDNDNSSNMSNQQGGAAQQARGGGLMRTMGAGLAGGFLGSMLFSSIGQAAGVGGAGGGGGIGMLEILLFAGLAYFGFRWWKSRQQAQLATAGAPMARGYEAPMRALGGSGLGAGAAGAQSNFEGLDFAPEAIDSDTASDIFFKVQGAWTRRDLSSIRANLTSEMQEQLGRDIEALRQEGRINRLENISIRRVDVQNSWREMGQELSTVRFTANLLDYSVDEQSGRVVEGSDSDPVKFEEDWTFLKNSSTNSWQLAGIEQV